MDVSAEFRVDEAPELIFSPLEGDACDVDVALAPPVNAKLEPLSFLGEEVKFKGSRSSCE